MGKELTSLSEDCVNLCQIKISNKDYTCNYTASHTVVRWSLPSKQRTGYTEPGCVGEGQGNSFFAKFSLGVKPWAKSLHIHSL